MFSNAERVLGTENWRRIRKVLLWGLGFIASFALIGFVAVPPIVKPVLEKELSKALHREVTVERLRVNPFAPSATVGGFVMREPSGNDPFATFDELYLNVGWSSIARLAPVIDEAKLTKPHVRVIRNPDGTYNFQDLIDEFLARPNENEPPPKFAAFNLELVDGGIDIDDRAGGEKHSVTDLRIGIPFISSLPADVDVTVAPELSARVDGAPVDVKGSTLPFKDTQVTTLNVDLDTFDLTRIVNYLPFKLHGTVKSALLDTRLTIAFEQRVGTTPQIKVRGSAAVTQLNVLDLQGRPMVACQRIAVEINEVDALAPAVDLKSLEIEAPDVHVRRDKAGAINLERVGLVAAEGDQMQRRSRQKTGKAAVPVKFGALFIKAGTLRFTDETTAPAFDTMIKDLQIQARDFDNTAKDRRNEAAVRARTEAGESLKFDLATTADPRTAEGRLEVENLRLKSFQPYVSQATNLQVDDGQFDIGFDFKWVSDLAYEKHELSISDLALALKRFRARMSSETEPLFRVASIEVKGAGADLRSRTANLGTIMVREASMQLRRERDGKLNLERIARPGTAGTQSPSPSPAETAAPAAAPWQLEFGSFSLERTSVALEDFAAGAPVRLDIAPVQFTVKNFSNAKGHLSDAELHATIEKHGTFAASGSFSLEPLAGAFRIDARTIDFARAQRYFDDRTNFTVTSGAVSAKGTAEFERAPNGGMKASYRGGVGVTDFAAEDKPEKAELLKWKSLSIDAVDFNLEPLKVGLGEIALTDFYGRIVISSEGRLNLQDLMRPGGASAEKGQATANTAPPPPGKRVGTGERAAAAPADTLPRDIRLGPVLLKGGAVDFSDFFIRPNYRAKLSDIHGSLTEMAPDRSSEVELHARAERAAEVEIVGRVNPLSPRLFLDLQGKVRAFELPPLSTYSMKYVGYGIENGKLTLNVRYRVENNKLEATNNIVLDQLTLGEKVESADATKLPVPAAVSILKDRNGVIDVNVPISGSLDDPKFSFSAAAIQAVGSLVTNAATAPFSVLGASVGGGAELSYVEFAPGSAALNADAIGKLKTLTKLLNERPNLALDVIGRVDPIADRTAIQGVTAGAAAAEVDGMELQQLANARAEAARSWLVKEGKVPPSRISIASPKLTAEGIKDKGKTTRVDFGLK